MLKDKLNGDIKTAMLAGDKARAEVLKSLKSAFLYEEVAQKSRQDGLADSQLMAVIAREVKKRLESATMYQKANQQDRADIELSEMKILEEYLPQQLSDDDLQQIVKSEIMRIGQNAQMGQIISAVKAKVGQTADGARIAAAVKIQLNGA